MNIASRWMVVLGLTATFCVVAPTPRAAAQEVQVTGPLAGAPAVRHMRIYRDKRFQLQLGMGFTMQDEFKRHIMIMGQAQYNFVDWLGLGLFGAYSVAKLDTDLTDQISANGISTEHNKLSLPTAEGFKKQAGTIDSLFGVQLTFIPLRGKLALFQALFVDTDFYIFAGAAMSGVTERSNAVPGTAGTGGQCANWAQDPASMDPAMGQAACSNSQEASSSRFAVAPTFGVGLSLFLADYAGVTLEWRAFPFKWNNSGTDEAGMDSNRQPSSSGAFPDGRIDENDRLFHFNQMMSINASFYFPVKAKISE